MVEIAAGARDPLAEALARDLDGAFEAMVREYEDRLYSFALRLTGRREDAEDVAQDAFVRAYRALQGYGLDRVRALALKAWLYRITLNVVRNRYRGKKRVFVPLEDWDASDDPSDRPDARAEKRRERESDGGLPIEARAAVAADPGASGHGGS